MKLLILSPTVFEIAPLLKYLESDFELNSNVFHQKDLQVKVKVSGVGLTNTAINTCLEIQSFKPNICILAGVCGSYTEELKIGEVLNVVEEEIADLGAEEKDGSFLSVFDLGLLDKDAPPYKNGILQNVTSEFGFLKRVKGISVNTTSGQASTIEKLRARSNPHIENMEGAAFFQACLQLKTPFIQIRSVSNMVEERNKENWNLPLAIDNLNSILKEMLETIV